MTDCLFIDFDGTLADPRRRLYELFRDLAPEATISFDAYWQLKRTGLNQRQLLTSLLGWPDERINRFREEWLRMVEAADRLELDRPIAGAAEFLDQAYHRSKLYLITARQHPESLMAQLRRFDWIKYFAEVLVTEQRRSKADLIRLARICTPADSLVGDTGEDILAGKELGIRTIAVTSGMSGPEALLKFDPDLVVPSVADLIPVGDTHTVRGGPL